MCGISGKLSFNGRPDQMLGDRMIKCMLHRGPDDSGIHMDGSVMLAHRRLSIIDPSDAGHQPMSNADGTAWIVYNGEVYNYRELRERVPDYSFKSETDTEVILALYDEYGVDCLDMLRGMFAFAIWDAEREHLFLARDRLGQKPLFYHYDETGFRFGSTIKAILADDYVEAEPDLGAIRSFLTYQYVPHPETGFEGIRRVNPGEYLVVTEENIRRERYWSVSHEDQFDADPSTLANRLRTTLREATKLRTRSDVPVGVFLSGGIDSTIVTGLMSEVTDTPVETYSIGFDEYDELEYARAVADEYGTNHHEHTVTPDALEVLPELVEHYEMPFGDPSAVPTYYVSQIASDDITVALGGDAGDENFAGYDRYTYDRMTEIASRLPKRLRTLGTTALGDIPKGIPLSKTAQRGKRLLANADGDAVERYAPYVCHMLGEEASRVWAGEASADELAYLRRTFERADGPTRLDRVMNVDLRTYLPDDLLFKVDRASMAHSLEVRSPFLDHELVEFASRIPAKYKWRRGTKKWLLKRAFAEYIPERVRGRQKQGFSVPVDTWFRNDLRSFARESLERLGTRPPFDADGLEWKVEAHVSGEANYGHHLWDLVMLEKWYESFID